MKFQPQWFVLPVVALFLLSVQVAELLAQSTDFGEYVIGAGDILEIQVWDHNDLNRTVEVSQKGDFSFPLIGRIHAEGLTIFGLEKLLTQKLADGYIVAPHVTVGISEYQNQKVYLFGAVKTPGSYTIKGKASILEVISTMGGVTDETGTKAIIVRPKSETRRAGPVSIEEAALDEIIEVDLDHLISGKINKIFFVIPGDSIYVRKASNIFVIGEVKKPGKYRWEKSLTVREAIGIAGGPSNVGAPNRTRILRIKNGKETKIKPEMSDWVLPEDIIKVPKSYF